MSDDYMCPNCETEARAISILTAAVFGDQETPKWFRDRVNDVAEAAREQGRRAALDAVEPPDGPDTRAGQTFWDENAHRVDLPAVSAPPEPPDGPDPVRDLDETEVEFIAEALAKADYMNWTASEVASKIAGSIRALIAARAALSQSENPDREGEA